MPITQIYYNEDKLLAAVDCIIFGFDNEELKVLLIKRDFEPEKGKWSLVGGFLHRDETLETAAQRILNLYTGLDDIFMEQVATYSDVDRDPGERTISTSYYALINIQQYSKDLISRFSAKWFSLSAAPPLIFDHEKMVRNALERLRERTKTKPVGFELLPEKFTMRQLQKLYETIWGKEFDKRNFINKIRTLNILEKLDEKDMSSSKKGSFLFRFNADYYKTRNLSGPVLNL